MAKNKGEFKRSAFAKSLLAHAIGDRVRREGGRALPEPWWYADWTDGLFPELRPAAAEVVAASGLELHSHIQGVNSSMAFAFNLFLPFRAWSVLPLQALLSEKLGRRLSVETLHFEYCDGQDILGEWRGDVRTRDDRCTTSDVAITVRDGEHLGVVLLEVKCGEEHFTPCNGAESPGNRRRDVCASATTFLEAPTACYLTRPLRATKPRTYWRIFERESGSIGGAFPGADLSAACPFAGDNQQPMRNHALALGLVQAGKVDFAFFGLVHHDQNPDIPPRWEAYTKLVAQPAMLFRLQATELLQAPLAVGKPWDAWRNYLCERYALPTLGRAL